jgi:hypothetical protein
LRAIHDHPQLAGANHGWRKSPRGRQSRSVIRDDLAAFTSLSRFTVSVGDIASSQAGAHNPTM